MVVVGGSFYVQREQIRRLEQARDTYHAQLLQAQTEQSKQQSRDWPDFMHPGPMTVAVSRN
jgi:hypothetical protein